MTEIVLKLEPSEAQFILENLSQLNIPLKQANAGQLVALGRGVIEKIEHAAQELAGEQLAAESQAAHK